ncbi:hypothetical protein NMY22_g18359 [Coprinellus aureogranulatus]|nr:hypothetical protein NMY22_g18359 [Coprinellus aureogranulatus]
MPLSLCTQTCMNDIGEPNSTHLVSVWACSPISHPLSTPELEQAHLQRRLRASWLMLRTDRFCQSKAVVTIPGHLKYTLPERERVPRHPSATASRQRAAMARLAVINFSAMCLASGRIYEHKSSKAHSQPYETQSQDQYLLLE